MSDWYVSHQGEQKGPVSAPSVVDFLRTRDPARVHVWRQGMEDWVLAQGVPELMQALCLPPPPPPIAPPAPPLLAEPREFPLERSPAPDSTLPARSKPKWAILGALITSAIAFFQIKAGEHRGDLANPDLHAVGYLAGYLGGAALLGAFIGLGCARLSSSARSVSKSPPVDPSPAPASQEPSPVSSADPPRYNVVRRHWRGELPLWVSYWVFGFIGNLVVGLLAILIAAIFHVGSGFYPPAIFATIIVTWTSTALVMTWQLVGVWRSAAAYRAARRNRGKGSGWAAVAQLAVVLGVLRVIWSFVDAGAPQIAESWRMAFAGDPRIPAYAIRVMRDGTEAEIIGGLKYGLTDEFTKILDASRRVRLVHLDSIGGRLGEGEKLFHLIRDRGLSTYVASKCMSACTLAFAGGRQRFLRKGASLGFHRGAFPGLKERDFDVVQADVFRRAGFDESFIRRALTTPHSDIWEPSADVLVAAKVVTTVTDGANFAVSGLGRDFDRTNFATGLADASPVFRAMRTRFPKKYDQIVDQLAGDLVTGRTFTETVNAGRSSLLPFIRELTPMADDDVLADYDNLLVDQYIELTAKDPTSCYKYISGEDPSYDVASKLSDGLITREHRLQERIVTTAVKRHPADKAQVDSLWTIVRDSLAKDGVGDADLELLESPHVETSKHPRYCAVAIALYRKIGRLRPENTAMLMRDILAAK
jgi:GYF domain 2